MKPPTIDGPGTARRPDTPPPAAPGFDEALRKKEEELGVTRTPPPEKPKPGGPQPLDAPPQGPPPPPTPPPPQVPGPVE